jgi:hypothetical protein
MVAVGEDVNAGSPFLLGTKHQSPEHDRSSSAPMMEGCSGKMQTLSANGDS